jgi:glycosyltransferase involved in cell wall biosynthesis
MDIRVSTIIPVYNGAATVGAAIDSALAQDFDGQEIIVVNDGSTDDTAQILAAYGSRIRVITQENRGLAAARNAGCAIAKGEYLAFLDADDEWFARKLEYAVEALESSRRSVLAFSDHVSINDEGTAKIVRHPEASPGLKDLLTGGWGILPSTVVMCRSVFERCGGFCEDFVGAGGGDDAYMWLLARECGEFIHIREPLVRYRESPPGVLVSKYAAGAVAFRRLVNARYGRRARPLLGCVRAYFAALLVADASERLNRGDLRGALKRFGSAFLTSPAHFFDARVPSRLIQGRNVRRLLRAVSLILRQGSETEQMIGSEARNGGCSRRAL